MYLDDWENQSTTEETGKPGKGGGGMNHLISGTKTIWQQQMQGGL